MKTLFILLGAAVVLALVCGSVSAAEYTFYPVEDAWVNEANPGTNYGSNTYLSVKDRSGLAEAFLRFSSADLAALSGQSIAGASLWMYQYQGTFSPADTLNLHAVNAPWSEAALVWDNKPAYDPYPVSGIDIAAGNNLWRQWSGLEGLVFQWASGGQQFGLAVENNRDGVEEELFARFYSAEYADPALRPHLRVTTTPEPVSSLLFLLGAGTFASVTRKRRKGQVGV
jgi:hypothetical protein